MRMAVLVLIMAGGAACDGPTSPVPSGMPSAVVQVQPGPTGSSGYPGQSFQLDAGQRIDHVRFSWYRRNGDPAAAGTLYLLTQEFIGLPGDLGPFTYGYLAHSTRVEGDLFVFPEQVTLSAGVTYFVYADTQQAYSYHWQTDTYAGGAMYHSSHGTRVFRRTPGQDVSFRLEGVLIGR